jgi:hypothetical protein
MSMREKVPVSVSTQFRDPRVASPILDRAGACATVGLDHALQHQIESQHQAADGPSLQIDSLVLLFSYV